MGIRRGVPACGRADVQQHGVSRKLQLAQHLLRWADAQGELQPPAMQRESMKTGQPAEPMARQFV
jgi:hypothetical protein